MKQTYASLLFTLLSTLSLLAQSGEGRLPALDHLRRHAVTDKLTDRDLAELRITDRHASASSGVEHVYVHQLLYGTPVHNALATVHLRGGEVVHYDASRLQPRLTERATAVGPSLSSDRARSLLGDARTLRIEEEGLTYLPRGQKLYLAWRFVVERTDEGMHYLRMIDATTGEELLREKLTVSCAVEPKIQSEQRLSPPSPQRGRKPSLALMSPTYHVLPFGLESPSFGARTRVQGPSDEIASPYGWHDTDGRPGPEYTTARGNNVHAYRDAAEPFNKIDPGGTADGGTELNFDFPFDPAGHPDSISRASITQLFYSNNMLHDWTYHHGFDEAAGNFQATNYGGRGRGGDAVRAESQDGGALNNANFYTPPDGHAPRMQMFMWSRSGSMITVATPSELAGELRSTGAAFGTPLSRIDTIVGELVAGRDDKNSRGCGTLINPEELKGKIVLLKRGNCPFQQKAYRAEQAGAIALVVQHSGDNPFIMGAMEDGEEFPVTIPSVMMRSSDAGRVREALKDGQTVTLQLINNTPHPVDGSFDNGVVAHEYGHGISNRLVGGPSIVTCLRNNEQMGEGWSDFFALASTPRTAEDNPNGREKRSIGMFSNGNPRGIRSQPYSTDMDVNDLTYDDVITARLPHGLGEIWAATLWDVYWAMVDAYGFDEDLINGTGGNNDAVRLVIEAMKYTPCGPGLVDARDGLLLADRFENGGANECMLWEVFRRRGLGYSADQGEGTLHNDGREAFDMPPSCIPTVKVSLKPDTTYITPGDVFGYTLAVRNDKPTAVTGLTIAGELPEGLSPVSNTLTGSLTFEVESLAPGERIERYFRVTSDPTLGSRVAYASGAEEVPDSNWTVSAQDSTGWMRADTLAYAGEQAWFVRNTTAAADSRLRLSVPDSLTGSRPSLRFFTHYDTEPAYDAGIIQVRRRGSEEWRDVDQNFLRYRYRGTIDDGGAPTLRGRPSFWGRNGDAYAEVIVDLGEYRGEQIDIRWRFVSDASVGAEGWWVDDVEVYDDRFAYRATATVTTTEGDRVTSTRDVAGVTVGPSDITIASRDRAQDARLSVYPNPVSNQLNVRLEGVATGAVSLSVLTVTGRTVSTQRLHKAASELNARIPAGNLRPGTYLLRLSGEAGHAVRRFVVARR